MGNASTSGRVGDVSTSGREGEFGKTYFCIEKICHVLKDVGDRPVVIVSLFKIAEKFKPFLLNSIVQYLNHSGKRNATEWIHPDLFSKDIYKKMSNKHTVSEIKVWPEYFVLAHPLSGEEICVILMDTPGVLGKNKYNDSIDLKFASFFTSLTIIGFENDFKREMLKIFKEAFPPIQKPDEDSDWEIDEEWRYYMDEKSYLGLSQDQYLFLVTDYSERFSLGLHDDNTLNPNFKKILTASSFDIENAHFIKKNFGVFLLPPSRKRFYSSNLDPNFVNFLKSFVELCFSSKYLTPREIASSTATGTTLLQYFKRISVPTNLSTFVETGVLLISEIKEAALIEVEQNRIAFKKIDRGHEEIFEKKIKTLNEKWKRLSLAIDSKISIDQLKYELSTLKIEISDLKNETMKSRMDTKFNDASVKMNQKTLIINEYERFKVLYDYLMNKLKKCETSPKEQQVQLRMPEEYLDLISFTMKSNEIFEARTINKLKISNVNKISSQISKSSIITTPGIEKGETRIDKISRPSASRQKAENSSKWDLRNEFGSKNYFTFPACTDFLFQVILYCNAQHHVQVQLLYDFYRNSFKNLDKIENFFLVIDYMQDGISLVEESNRNIIDTFDKDRLNNCLDINVVVQSQLFVKRKVELDNVELLTINQNMAVAIINYIEEYSTNKALNEDNIIQLVSIFNAIVESEKDMLSQKCRLSIYNVLDKSKFNYKPGEFGIIRLISQVEKGDST